MCQVLAKDMAVLRRAILDDELFLLVIVGQFRSGNSLIQHH